MANYFRQDNTAASVKLPIKWLAIESIHDGVFSEKTDVVSQNRNKMPHATMSHIINITLSVVVLWSADVGSV